MARPRTFEEQSGRRGPSRLAAGIAAYLVDIPGRKSLMWFAGSVPWTINPDFSLVTDATGRVDTLMAQRLSLQGWMVA
jgi:hypothetical protein